MRKHLEGRSSVVAQVTPHVDLACPCTLCLPYYKDNLNIGSNTAQRLDALDRCFDRALQIFIYVIRFEIAIINTGTGQGSLCPCVLMPTCIQFKGLPFGAF